MDTQEARIYTAVLITCIVLGSILIYFIISIIRQQRRNLQLHKERSNAEIIALEKERSRIAADLHDEIAPYVSVAKMKLSTLEFSNQESEEEGELITQYLEGTLKKIREISFGLMPANLLKNGLIPALNIMIGQVNDSYKIEVAFVAEVISPINEQLSINLYRIVQEVLHNAVKHSGATDMIITFREKNKLLIINIADNGVGFDYDHFLENTEGFGLRSIRNRTELIGGKLFVQSAKGKGISYVFEIPLS